MEFQWVLEFPAGAHEYTNGGEVKELRGVHQKGAAADEVGPDKFQSWGG